MALGIAAIVMICAGSFGGVVSLATIFHQLLFSRDHQINAQLHKRALEQQQSSLAQIRQELSATKQKDINLYEDSKLSLSSIDRRLEIIYKQKSDLIEHHIYFLDKHLSNNNNLANLNLIKEEFNHDFRLQLESVEQRLKSILSEREQLLTNQISLVKVMQISELDRSKQLNKLYETHSRMIAQLQHNFSKQEVTLSELFIKSSVSLIELAIIAPVKFIGSYFKSNSQNNNERTDKEQNDREKIYLLERQLNRLGIGHSSINVMSV